MTPVRGTARNAGMVTSSLTRPERSTSPADIDFGAFPLDAVLLARAGGSVAASTMHPIGREIVARAGAVGEADAAGADAGAPGAILSRRTRDSTGAAVLERLDACPSAAQAVRQAGGLVQTVVAERAIPVALADQWARRAARRQQD